jgi:hypothetical protein
MSKYYGKVGFMDAVKTDPESDVYTEQIVEHPYYGDILEHGSRWQSGQYLIDNRLLTIKISIVADPYAYENFSKIKYVEYGGHNWTVTSIDIQRPRLVLTIGDLYNEQTTSTSR